MKRKIRMGMVGGGPGAFIGGVHRMAARMDGLVEFVCGAFSQDPAKSRAMAGELFLPAERCYADYETMVERERVLPVGERMDFVAITTPNVFHYKIAMRALECGFHVLCDKPMTISLEEALQLRERVRDSGLLFCLMHNYSAYPMVRQAKVMCNEGRLGTIRKVVVNYDLGWLAAPNAGKQALWRCDPRYSGICACIGDIGTHAEQLTEYITGLRITEVCADLATFVEGRELDDDGTVLLRFDSGARGVIEACEVASGEENRFQIRIYGTTGSLEWSQMEPESLIWRANDQPMQIYRRMWAGMDPSVAPWCRLPAGHPEGFIEGFANIYSDFARAINARLEGRTDYKSSYPTVEDGVRGMAFIETVFQSHQSAQKWTPMPRC